MAGTAVTLKVNRRARRVSLRLDRTRREIVATAPSPRRLSEAAAFARERATWIAERIAELPDAAPIRPGMMLDVFGEPVRLETGAGRAKWFPATADQPARPRRLLSCRLPRRRRLRRLRSRSNRRRNAGRKRRRNRKRHSSPFLIRCHSIRVSAWMWCEWICRSPL